MAVSYWLRNFYCWPVSYAKISTVSLYFTEKFATVSLYHTERLQLLTCFLLETSTVSLYLTADLHLSDWEIYTVHLNLTEIILLSACILLRNSYCQPVYYWETSSEGLYPSKRLLMLACILLETSTVSLNPTERILLLACILVKYYYCQHVSYWETSTVDLYLTDLDTFTDNLYLMDGLLLSACILLRNIYC